MFDYKKLLPLFIAHGNPSKDTLRHYTDEIDNYLQWVDGNDFDAMAITDLDARIFLRYLIESGYSEASVNLKIAAVRTFYNIAKQTGAISVNPFADIKAKSPSYDDTDFIYLSNDEVAAICQSLANSTNAVNLRNLSIVMLMAVEGLRTVEVHRMSDTDYNPKNNALFIHGKGHDGFIYPCRDTLTIIARYLDVRPDPIADEFGVPTFVSFAKSAFGKRISRNGIRWSINNILRDNGKKQKGASCHMLRHSCGTNLYAATKDIRLVQETLRQKDPATTARYAHVNQRLENRATEQLSPWRDFPIDQF